MLGVTCGPLDQNMLSADKGSKVKRDRGEQSWMTESETILKVHEFTRILPALVLEFEYKYFPLKAHVKDLVPSLMLLGGGRIFRRWSLVGGS